MIAASGPSQTKADLDHARGRALVMVINNTWTLAPWADALYACDVRWWQSAETGYGRQAMREFGGRKFVGKGEYPGCVSCRATGKWDRMRWCGKQIGTGGNSGFQAVNLAAVCGAAKIVLTGYDMSTCDGAHWHGNHDGMSDPEDLMLQGCARMLDGSADELRMCGVQVVNASRKSTLNAYPRMTIEAALA